jgi:hypothetical protein
MSSHAFTVLDLAGYWSCTDSTASADMQGRRSSQSLLPAEDAITAVATLILQHPFQYKSLLNEASGRWK